MHILTLTSHTACVAQKSTNTNTNARRKKGGVGRERVYLHSSRAKRRRSSLFHTHTLSFALTHRNREKVKGREGGGGNDGGGRVRRRRLFLSLIHTVEGGDGRLAVAEKTPLSQSHTQTQSVCARAWWEEEATWEASGRGGHDGGVQIFLFFGRIKIDRHGAAMQRGDDRRQGIDDAGAEGGEAREGWVGYAWAAVALVLLPLFVCVCVCVRACVCARVL